MCLKMQVVGVEPTVSRLQGECIAIMLHLRIDILVEGRGIEPQSRESKSRIIPLDQPSIETRHYYLFSPALSAWLYRNLIR